MVRLSEILDWYFHGEPGKTIFASPFKIGVLDHNLEEGGALIKKVAEAGDTRSLVLLSAMISELYVDRLLSSLLPKYDKLLRKDRDFTFSTKIKLLESFCVIPSHLTKAADLVREVRNAFAHDLHVSQMDDLDTKLLKKLRNLYTERRIRTDLGPDDLKNLFSIILYMATDVLYSYRTNLQYFTAAVRQASFAKMLHDVHDEELAEQVNALRTVSPKT